jgi:molybdopterin-guanine dinucleotide biosynthesis protein A
MRATMISKEGDLPPLNGLVLTGGKSKRMGKDKGTISWHGTEQRYYLAGLLQKFCEEVFLSCRREQLPEIKPPYKALPDAFGEAGPLGAVLSAFGYQSGRAWLVVACDLPMLDEETLRLLTTNRVAGKIATVYASPYDGQPEPMPGIWEPGSRPLLLDCLTNDNASLRKVLITNDTVLLPCPGPDALMNVNTPEDARKAIEILSRGTLGKNAAGKNAP